MSEPVPAAPSGDEALFPSGPWVGYYMYSASPGRHRMELGLTFSQGKVTGRGTDDIGLFTITGSYDVKELEATWWKGYPGSHRVWYRGFREGKGIWGTWEIPPDGRGGFHIWPKGLGEAEELTLVEEAPVDATADAVAPGATGASEARG